MAEARRFFEQAIDLHGVPDKVTIDKSGANTAAVRGSIADSGVSIELRQSRYLNNLIEQDHRAIKRRTRPMLGFKDFHSAAKIIASIEVMHMIRKGQWAGPKAKSCPQQSCSTAWPTELPRFPQPQAVSPPLLRQNRIYTAAPSPMPQTIKIAAGRPRHRCSRPAARGPMLSPDPTAAGP